MNSKPLTAEQRNKLQLAFIKIYKQIVQDETSNKNSNGNQNKHKFKHKLEEIPDI